MRPALSKTFQLYSLRRLGMASAGSVCLVAGLILYPLPIPLGLPLLILGLSLWMRSSPAVKVWVFRRTKSWPRIRRLLFKLSGGRKRQRTPLAQDRA